MDIPISPKPFAALAVIGLTVTAALAMERRDVADFETLVGVDEAFLGPETLRGVPGGGLPWTLDEGEAKVTDDGEVEARVQGLVIDRPGHPADGTNPVDRFFVTLSCLDRGTGNATNLHTAAVPATEGGDAEIDGETVPLPSGGCVAPVLLVRGDLSTVADNPEGPDPQDPWFAASGSAPP